MNKERKILKWLFEGDVGQSSKAMAMAASGVYQNEEQKLTSHPYDVSDINRCFQLIKAVPEVKDSFDIISNLSPEWSALIKHWEQLESTFVEEVGEDWKSRKPASNTYQLMKDIFQQF